jgi:uroporphyrinogen decarboxylase
MPLISRTLESGVTAIQCIDPIAGMDIVELKKQVDGKLALIGNINISNLEKGPIEEIDAEVKRVVEGCKGNGGFVLSACNAIFKGMPVENYMAMVEARYKYGIEDKMKTNN